MIYPAAIPAILGIALLAKARFAPPGDNPDARDLGAFMLGAAGVLLIGAAAVMGLVRLVVG